MSTPTQYSIKLIKEFPYRGDPAQRFSNRYHFDGGDPGSGTNWDALSDALVLLEKTIYSSDVKIVAAVGYGPGSDLQHNTKAYTTSGTLTAGGTTRAPGDCAAFVRFATTKLSTKNHTVYCMSYYHGCRFDPTAGDPDVLWSAQKTVIDAYALDWVNGITVGGRTYKRTTPDGHAVTGRLTSSSIGHRDFLD